MLPRGKMVMFHACENAYALNFWADAVAPLIPLSEALRLHRLMQECPYRSRAYVCESDGVHCALRRGSVIHLECLDCVRRYG